MSSRYNRFKDWTTRHRRLGRWSLGVLVAVCIVIAIAVALFVAAQQIVPGYRDLIRKTVSARLHAPVELGRVSLGWHGWGPELDLKKVAVRNPQTGRVVIGAKRLRLDFSLFALIHGTGARPSGIELDQPHLVLQQTATGGFRVPGVRFTGAGPGAGMLGLSIEAHDGTLKLLFDNPKLKPWIFAPLDLDIGGGKTHAVQLSVGLPKPLGGDKLRVVGSVKTPKIRPETWQWQGEAAVDRLLIAPFDRYLPVDWPAVTGALAFDINAQGRGGRIAKASGRLAATKLAAGAGRLKRFATHFALAMGNGFHLTLNDDVFELPQRTWRPGKVVFVRLPQGRLQINIARVDLAALPPLADFLPPAHAKLVARIHKMRPTGTIRDLDAALTPGHMQTLALAARLDDVGVYAAAGAPGFNHLAGKIEMQHGMGIFALDAPGFTLRMPHIFSHTVPLSRAVGKIGIALTGNEMRIAMPRLRISGPAGLDGGVMATITIPHGGDARARLAAWAAPIAANAGRPLYIPTGLLPKPLTAWLMNQLRDGSAGPMRLRLVGDMKRFPFQHGGGYFSVVFGVHRLALAPGKGWAPITDIAGTVRFEDASMRADMTSGEVEGARIRYAQATIPDLFHPQLTVKTEIAGTLPDFIAFLKKSPVGGDLKGVFDQVKVAGKARTRLTLQLPIMHPKRLKLAGTLDLNDATLAYGARPWALEHLSGNLSYDERGPTDGKLTGSLLDAPVRIALTRTGGTQGEQHLGIRLAGRFPVATLSRVANTDFSRYASGDLPLVATLAVPLSANLLPITVDLSSDLQGLEIKLPVPAGKSAIAKRPFTARLRVDKTTLGIEAHYADVASVCAGLATGGAQPKLLGVELRFGAGVCRQPQSGIFLRGGWRKLNVKPWLAMLPKQKAAAAKANLFHIAHLDADLRFGDIRVFGQQFKNQIIRGILGPEQMKLSFDGPDLAGTATVPHKPTNADPITVVLTRGHFTLPHKPVLAKPPASGAAASTAAVPEVAQAKQDAAKRGNGIEPQDIPPFVLRAKQIVLGTALLNDVNVVGRRVPNGIVIKPIHIGGGALEFDGQFAWLNPPETGPQGALQFVANISDLGKLLAGLGLGPVATGHGALSAGLAWHEPRAGAKFASGLLGKVSTDLRSGSIAQVSPGAGRLLSLLSLVNIPRYLVFNFHNLFSKGFPFSRIWGDYNIRNGIATTKGLHIESSIADINLTGTVNLVNETMDQTAEVEPNYFGSLPVIGALIGGLGVGAVIFALTKLFGNPLGKAFAMEYSVRGPITNPVVKKVSGQPPPQRAPAAATAGGL